MVRLGNGPGHIIQRVSLTESSGRVEARAVYHHPRAKADQVIGNHPPDPAGRAGHPGDFAVQTSLVSHLSSQSAHHTAQNTYEGGGPKAFPQALGPSPSRTRVTVVTAHPGTNSRARICGVIGFSGSVTQCPLFARIRVIRGWPLLRRAQNISSTFLILAPQTIVAEVLIPHLG